MVEALQAKEDMEVKVPQFGLKINPKTKKIHAQKHEKVLKVHAKSKRFFRPDISPCRTFQWGVTNWDTVNSPLCEELYYQNLSCKGTEIVTLK